MKRSRRSFVAFLAAAIQSLAAQEAWSQYGVTQSLPASVVIMNGGSDGWHSRGGVVGPWWSGSATNAMPPAADGGFWFGTPSLGFGGSQGSTRGMNTFAPSVTSTSGGVGITSSTRLVPFVAGVVPVVGSGYPVTPVASGPLLSTTGSPMAIPISVSPTAPHCPPVYASAGPLSSRPSTPEARSRAKERVAAADRRLLDAADMRGAAKDALIEYRTAARLAQDEADIEIRIAIILESLGKRRDADRALTRATRIDRRLAETSDGVSAEAGGFLAEAPQGVPAIAMRGFQILEQLSQPTAPGNETAPNTESSSAITWLTEAWSRRWNTTPESASRVAP